MLSFNGTEQNGNGAAPASSAPSTENGAEGAALALLPSSRQVVRAHLRGLFRPLRRPSWAPLHRVDARRRTVTWSPPEELQVELSRSRRFGHPFVLVRIPCGRAENGGSNGREEVARTVSSLLRRVDRVWPGGTSLYLLLPECDRAMGEAMLARIREPLAKLLPEEDLLAIIREKLARPDPYNETLTDGDYYRAGIANLLEQPSSWPERLWVNSLELFLLPSDLVLAEPDSAPGQRWFRPVWRPLSALLTILALTGFVQVLLRHRNRAVLFVPWLFQAGVIVLMSAPQARYAVPFWPTMFVAAAVPLVAIATYAARSVGSAPLREKQDVPSSP